MKMEREWQRWMFSIFKIACCHFLPENRPLHKNALNCITLKQGIKTSFYFCATTILLARVHQVSTHQISVVKPFFPRNNFARESSEVPWEYWLKSESPRCNITALNFPPKIPGMCEKIVFWSCVPLPKKASSLGEAATVRAEAALCSET